MAYYFQSEKARLARQRTREASKGVGKPRIGGEFELVDQDGKRFTSADIKGKFSLVSLAFPCVHRMTMSTLSTGLIRRFAVEVHRGSDVGMQIYFGFTHCPDICPDELDKMAKMIDIINDKRGNVLKPIFVTCDPNRDSAPVVKSYLSEFHPSIVGLTGTWEQVKAMCKAYRVYFSTPPHVKPGQDYLVDHSIYFYLMGRRWLLFISHVFDVLQWTTDDALRS